VACGALEGKSVVWDVLTGTVVATIGSLRRAYEVSLNFDGTQIICFDNEGCVYDVATGMGRLVTSDIVPVSQILIMPVSAVANLGTRSATERLPTEVVCPTNDPIIWKPLSGSYRLIANVNGSGAAKYIVINNEHVLLATGYGRNREQKSCLMTLMTELVLSRVGHHSNRVSTNTLFSTL
jgi:hypothetical protein